DAGIDVVVGMAVAEDEIEVAVVIVVEEFEAPAAHELSGGADAGSNGGVAEGFVLVVVIERIHFLIDIGDKEIGPAVLVVVGSVHAHTGARASVSAVAQTRDEAYLVEFSLLVDEEKILDGVVGNEQIHPSVVVDVAGDHTPGLGERFRDAGFLADVGKGAIAVVVKQPAGRGIVDFGDA